MTDIPYLNQNEIRGLFYIYEINREIDQTKPAKISTLANHSDWRSGYYTSLWKKLSPQLVKRERDGVNTRLSLTPAGESVVYKYQELNELFDEAGM